MTDCVPDHTGFACSVCGATLVSAVAKRNCGVIKLTNCQPGTALSSLLGGIGFHAMPDCECQSHAAMMDTKGCDWCEQNIDTIVGWLREAARKRNLPFVETIAKWLVARAIANARRKSGAA